MALKEPSVPTEGSEDQGGTRTTAMGSGGLEEVLANAELERRPCGPRRVEAEAEAMLALARTMAEEPARLFDRLVELALKICEADSAGISLVEESAEGPVFRWHATAGRFSPLCGQTLPRFFSPCGVVLDRNAVVLMRWPGRHFRYVEDLSEPVHEVLLAPFHDAGVPIGTVWVVAHTATRRFDAEDARLATQLSVFAAAAWQATKKQREIESSAEQLHLREREQARSEAELALTQRQVRLSEAKFREFFNHVPFYAGMLDTSGRVAEASRHALESGGFKPEQVVGRFFWDTPWWRGLESSQDELRRAVALAATGQRYASTLRFTNAAGEERLTEFSLGPVFDDQGRVVFLVATGNDITDRRRAEAALEQARKRSDSALIAGEVGTYEWDVATDHLYGDANFARIFGVEKGSGPLDVFLAAVHPDDRERVITQINRSVETGVNYEADYRVLAGAETRWVTARGRMTRDSAGRVVGFYGVVLDVTTRKHAESDRESLAERLRRLSAIHETVLSATNDFAYVFDLQGRFVYANRPLLELYARPFEKVVGRTFHELDYPAWLADRHVKEIAQVIATKRPIRAEAEFRGANGREAIYDYIFTPVFGADGAVELVAGTTRDVTERRRTQDRDRLLVALDDATRPLTQSDEITNTSARMLGEFLGVNRCAYADVEEDGNTFNLTGDYNHGVASIVGRYRFEDFGEECLRLMRAGQPFVVRDSETDPRTEQVRTAYRATEIRSVVCVPMLKAGVFVAAMAVHQTTPREWLPSEVELVQTVASRCWESIERTRVMRVLARSEHQLRLAVETGRLGVWELSLPARVLSCSVQCKAHYGRRAEQPFSYDDFWQAVHPEDRERVARGLEDSISHRRVHDMEYRTCWEDGAVHWVLVRGQAAYAEDGTPLRMIGVSLDITARKEAEREQVRLREEADRASRAKDEFLATLSHELRTPLNPVLLVASDAARDPAIPGHARALFEMIRKNVELEARLIDDLLDLTGIARGKIVIRQRDENLHAILDDALATVRSEFEQKRISVDVRLEAPRDQVTADAVRLLQVFLNLLKNAAKFTPADGRVALRTSEERGQIVVRLTDSGIGMTEAEIDRAFGAFEQGDHAASPGSRRFGGLGLGLAISRRLVEMHGGRISALSPGREKGSTFTVELPLRPVTSKASTPAPAPIAAQPRASGEPKRILLVEDHEPTRKTLEQLLRRRNFSVVTAGSVHEANQRATAASFDLLVSDLGLPDGDGAELMASMSERFGVVGIALTGYGMEQDIARCRAAGFVAHLTKPIRVESLESALAEVTGAPVSRV